MLYLTLALLPQPASDQGDADEGFLGKLLLRMLTRLRYQQALAQLNRLDSRDLDDLDLARADFPALAHRHAAGEAPLAPSGTPGLRRL
jgi:uncharacterized protein YjiS (DUF1127 family)